MPQQSRFSNCSLTDLIVDGPLDRVDTIAGGRIVSGVSGVQDQDGTGERESVGFNILVSQVDYMTIK